MIVGIIDVDGVTVLEAECHSPIPRHRNGIMPFQDSLQRVEPQARQVHILRCSAPLQDRENVTKFLDIFRRHALGRSPIVQRLKAAMFERPNHPANL